MTVLASRFSQNIIAIIWDFDKTLIPGYMQKPIFERYDVDETAFWDEVKQAANDYREQISGQVSSEVVYLNHIIDYVKKGKFAGLNNEILREMGKGLTFYPGLPDFFNALRGTVEDEEKYKKHDVRLEHYVISTGLRQIILGSQIAPYLTDVWGCDLLEEENTDGEKVLAKIGYVLDHTTKTRAVFEINKGVNMENTIDVNARMSEEYRRVPIPQMIYVADGPSDVPVFSVIERYQGKSLAVYPPDTASNMDSQPAYDQVYNLRQERRVDHMDIADFTAGSSTSLWLARTVRDIADKIVERQDSALKENVGKAPQHV